VDDPADRLLGRDDDALRVKSAEKIADEFGAHPRRAWHDDAQQAALAGGAHSGGRRVALQERADGGVLQARPEDTLDRWRRAQQQVAQPMRRASAVMSEVVVAAAEHAQLLEQLVVVDEPMHARLVDAGGIGDHEAVAPVGLRVTRVQLRGATHHQPGHVGNRDGAAARDRDGKRADRAGLIDHERCVLAGGIQQPLDRLLVVTHRTIKQRLANCIDDGGMVGALADVQADPDLNVPHSPSPVVVDVTFGLEGHLSRIHLTNEPSIGAGPYERHEVPDEPGGNTRSITKTGKREPCPSRRAPQRKWGSPLGLVVS
jgi:hypothetical protein